MHIQRILVPIDFSEQSHHALREADGLAKANGARLTLLHVHPIVEVAVLDFTYVQPPEKVAEICDAAEAKMRGWASELATPTTHISVEVATGAPVTEIVEHSGHHDLVVMATHGRTGMRHFLMGSVAERVVQGAQCSVLVVKVKTRPGIH